MKHMHLLAAGVGAAMLATTATAGTLDDVKNRGSLICGVTTGLAGFAAPDDRVSGQASTSMCAARSRPACSAMQPR